MVMTYLPAADMAGPDIDDSTGLDAADSRRLYGRFAPRLLSPIQCASYAPSFSVSKLYCGGLSLLLDALDLD